MIQDPMIGIPFGMVTLRSMAAVMTANKIYDLLSEWFSSALFSLEFWNMIVDIIYDGLQAIIYSLLS